MNSGHLHVLRKALDGFFHFIRRIWMMPAVMGGLVACLPLTACGEKPADLMPENRLAKEKSPYLRQHAKNPMDWYPWGEGAFAKARAENNPIFVSISYSTCHWCHVMGRESFSYKEIAAVMNANFINIKIDREERPDVDQVYMTFVQATTGSPPITHSSSKACSTSTKPDSTPAGWHGPTLSRRNKINFSTTTNSAAISHPAARTPGGPGQQFLASLADFYQSLTSIDGKATAYLCEDFICQLPTNDPVRFKSLLTTTTVSTK